MIANLERLTVAAQIEDAIRQKQLVVVAGEKGLRQKLIIDHALEAQSAWEHFDTNGNWFTGGYLAGFQDILDIALNWCSKNRPKIISRYEQSIKRVLPRYDNPNFKIPKDLTNTSSKDERTRFYHHEYQNKLLVGISEFLLEYLLEINNPTILKIDNASLLSPTATTLLRILLRNPASLDLIKFVVIDYNRQVFFPQATTIECPKYSYSEMAELLDLEHAYSTEKAHIIYMYSLGNPMLARALIACEQFGIPVSGYFDYKTIVDLYLATLEKDLRKNLVVKYIEASCDSDDYIEARNYETYDPEFADREHQNRHRQCMAEYEMGNGPLITFHANAIRHKFKRLEALAEPSEILKSIGLYDTWFTFFAEIFADPQLRCHGSGDDPSNAVFINAAFILYALGYGKVSLRYLDQFYHRYPESKFIPTVLYAQSMTYGRYQQPVNLELAEQYALMNLKTIQESFEDSEKYEYIKVFAENAYAYIKSRQGKYEEALELCTVGNARMLTVYGSDRFKLHQSILIYNTSQVYEIVKNYDQAEAQLRLAISYDPYYGEYHNDLGNILSKFPDRTDEALAEYAIAIQLCPPYFEAYLNRGMLYASLSDHLAAMKDFQRVLEIKPEEWRAFLEIGNLYLCQGKSEQALKFYRKGVSIEPLNADLQCNMGMACSECGNPETSVIHYRAAIALNPRHAVAHNNLAVELFNIGESTQALQHAKIAVEIGGDPDYESNLSYLEQRFNQ